MQLRGQLSAQELQLLEDIKRERFGEEDSSRVHRGYMTALLISEYSGSVDQLTEVIESENLSSTEGRREISLRISAEAYESLCRLSEESGASKIAVVRALIALAARELPVKPKQSCEVTPRSSAVRSVKKYLKEHFIPYEADIDDGILRLTMSLHADDAPGKRVESCIWFYNDSMEVRAYYTALGSEICRKSGRIKDLYRLLNYINARVWMKIADGAGGTLYAPSMRYNTRIYLTEDGCYDITAAAMIPYEAFLSAELMTMDYITAYSPELLNRLAPAIFGTLLGTLSTDEAIERIRTNT